MSIINVSNLSFSYEDNYHPIFEHVSFQINTDWRLGFIGRNGRGKTTFLNLLLGKYEYSGAIISDADFEYFPYSAESPDEMTYSVLETICPNAEDWRIFRELNLLQTDPEILYRPFSTLSNGERTKALLAALFLKENAFLLIDEPTNHLDLHARKSLAEYLKHKSGFILVSHDRAFLDSCIDHVLSINRADIEIQKGNFSSWYANKEAQDRLELSQNERLKSDIRKLDASFRQSKRWSDKVESSKTGTRIAGLRPDRGHIGHQAAKMMKRAKHTQSQKEKAIQEKEGLLKNIESLDELQINHLPFHARQLIELKEVSVFYPLSSNAPASSGADTDGVRQILEHFNLKICQGDRICLRGKNGCGKSSLLKLILGEEIPHTGVIRKASGMKISYISQDTSFLSGTLSEFSEHEGISETLLRTVLRKLGFERIQFEKRIENYSEGQKKKLLLAKSLCEPAHLFVWDEPLNFIDIFSRMQLEKLLLEYQPTLLFVEHDRAFQEAVSTKLCDLS